MTKDTLLLFQRLLDAQQLLVGDPEFAETAKLVLKAKEELATALALRSAPVQYKDFQGS